MIGSKRVQHMLKFTQKILFVIGATCAAAVLAAGVVALALTSLLPFGKGAWGAVGLIVYLIIAGGITGAITGLVSSTLRVVKKPAELWSIVT